jgi:hypothetical protein
MPTTPTVYAVRIETQPPAVFQLNLFHASMWGDLGLSSGPRRSSTDAHVHMRLTVATPWSSTETRASTRPAGQLERVSGSADRAKPGSASRLSCGWTEIGSPMADRPMKSIT